MNLKDTFNKELLPQLQEKLGIENVMAVPKLTKVVINMGVGEALTDKKHLESAGKRFRVHRRPKSSGN
jgi:large subunit ribosomal protein L5